MNHIQLPLQIDANLEGHNILAPKVSVRLGRDGLWSRPTLATVDRWEAWGAAQLGLLLRNAAVIVTELVPDWEVLIGQHDALERLRFIQRNQEPHWDFELALPEAPEGRR